MRGISEGWDPCSDAESVGQPTALSFKNPGNFRDTLVTFVKGGSASLFDGESRLLNFLGNFLNTLRPNDDCFSSLVNDSADSTAPNSDMTGGEESRRLGGGTETLDDFRLRNKRFQRPVDSLLSECTSSVLELLRLDSESLLPRGGAD